MKKFLIAAAAIATLGAALPAAAQTWDHGGRPVRAQVRPVAERFTSPWEIRRIEQRRLEERRAYEWRLRHERSHEGFRDSGFGYRR